jgi:hypothetical protein
MRWGNISIRYAERIVLRRGGSISGSLKAALERVGLPVTDPIKIHIRSRAIYGIDHSDEIPDGSNAPNAVMKVASVEWCSFGSHSYYFNSSPALARYFPSNC